MLDTKKQFWNTFLTSLETVPREAHEARGASGFVHPTLAVGVDEARRRTVIISGDPDARTAALAQADIQLAAGRSTKIVMARPVALNLQSIALSAVSHLGTPRFPLSLIELMNQAESKEKGEKIIRELLRDTLERTGRPFAYVPLNTLSFWKELIQQLSLLQFEGFEKKDGQPDIMRTAVVIFERLLSYDPVAIDRSGGVCAVPLYDLKEDDFEALARGDADYARACLVRHGVFQYFFPPADQIALAAIDRGETSTADAISRHVQMAPDLGHPLAPNELVDPHVRAVELVDALLERGYVAEGSVAVEVSPSGRVVREEVRYRPREGFIEKLLRRISMKLDISVKWPFI